jgi:hypothetical protein
MIKMPAKKTISRTPPTAVRKLLRAEVGFGCPARNCGSPHLEYHHFDPTFAQQPHHNPEGMIALCPTHHARANGYTNDQIRDLKGVRRESVSSNFDWKRKHTIFVCGSNFSYQCQAMLTVWGIDIVYFEKDDEGYDTLSLNIYDRCLNPVFVMRRNDWISRADVDDLLAPTSSRKLEIHSQRLGISVDIEFKDRQMLNGAELDKCRSLAIPEEENVVFCYFNGEIITPLPISFNEHGVEFRGNTFSGNTMVRCGNGIVIS